MLIATSIVAFVLASAFGAYEIARPGCSPFPVAIPTVDPRRTIADVGPAEACEVLGRPLPQITKLPPGVRLGHITYTPIPNTPAFLVTTTYAREERTVAQLTISKSDRIPLGNEAAVNGAVQGVPAIVPSADTRPPEVGNVLTYVWSRDGLFFVLHANAHDIDLAAVGAMAESVR